MEYLKVPGFEMLQEMRRGRAERFARPRGGGQEEVGVSSEELALESSLSHQSRSLEAPDLDALGPARAVEVAHSRVFDQCCSLTNNSDAGSAVGDC